MLSALSSQLSALRCPAAAALIATCVSDFLPAQSPPPVPSGMFHEFLTHDATTTVANTPVGLPEAWVDVKATGGTRPGEGWTFSVGTIEVVTTQPDDNPTFSDKDVVLPPVPVDPNGFIIPGTATFGTKQIVILQARGPDAVSYTGPNADQDIRWQVYLYGQSGIDTGPVGRAATNARAVSVWPVVNEEGELDPLETRVAICGETFECILPNNQFPPDPLAIFNGGGGWTKFGGSANFALGYPRGLPSGFIAVYRGNGELLWTHQFFFQDLQIVPPGQEGACAITDVSIRVEEVEGVMRDVVTYCGISSFGLRSTETTSLTPWRAFDLPGGTIEGANDNGLGQWDGIVGRISNVHSLNPVSGMATAKEFHSVVGGREQDGLWGLAEMPDDRFVVVGGTATMPASNPAIGSAVFPFTTAGPPPVGSGATWPGVDHCVGTMLVFDASKTRNPNAPNDLILEAAASLGRAGRFDVSTATATHLRDVVVQLDAFRDVEGQRRHRIVAVGGTNDPLLFSSFTTGGTVSLVPFGTGTDGFLVTAIDGILLPIPDLLFARGTFQGGPGDGSWCGVHAWNEYLDHAVAYGHVAGNGEDLQVASFFVDTPTPGSEDLVALRSDVFPTTPIEVPAAIGDIHAARVVTTNGLGVPQAGLGYETYGLGSPAGGGVAMDERGRVNVVGSTSTVGFPIGGGPLARQHLSGTDAVRGVVSMLPVRVGRTDGTGAQLHSLGTIPAVPAGRTGATTPTCALSPFGTQIDMAVPELRRMLIDWEGGDPAPSPPDPSNPGQLLPVHFLLVDRPRADTLWVGSIIQYGVPTAPPPGPLFADLENWVPSGVTHSLAVLGASQSFRIPLRLPSATGVTFSVQVTTMLNTPLACTGYTLASTPAIVFSY